MYIFHYRIGTVIFMWICHVILSNCPSFHLLYAFRVYSLSCIHTFIAYYDTNTIWLLSKIKLQCLYVAQLYVFDNTSSNHKKLCLLYFLLRMWNYQNNHKIGCHKMKNKQHDTVETDPKSHSKIVERVKIDTPSIHIHDRSLSGLVQTLQ